MLKPPRLNFEDWNKREIRLIVQGEDAVFTAHVRRVRRGLRAKAVLWPYYVQAALEEGFVRDASLMSTKPLQK